MKVSVEEDIKPIGIVRFTFRDALSGEILRVIELKNAVVKSGKTMIAKRLAQTGNDCTITYGAVGTDDTAVTEDDIALGAELARKQITIISYANNQVFTTTYFGPSEANGALKEFALFGEGASATPNSGTMFNHIIIDETKNSSETLTVECTSTIL